MVKVRGSAASAVATAATPASFDFCLKTIKEIQTKIKENQTFRVSLQKAINITMALLQIIIFRLGRGSIYPYNALLFRPSLPAVCKPQISNALLTPWGKNGGISLQECMRKYAGMVF